MTGDGRPVEFERELVAAVSLTSEPVGIPALAHFLDISESETLTLVESLSAQGRVTEEPDGVSLGAELVEELGAARRGRVAKRLAQSIEAVDGDPATIGSLLVDAGDLAGAFSWLCVVALDEHRSLQDRYAAAAQALAEAALGADQEVGQLHLVCARYLRASGRSEEAAAHLDSAVGRLNGPIKVDAYGFQAVVSDDRQRPQQAERILALGEWESLRQGLGGKYASLYSLRSKTLSRLGFGREADDMMSRSGQLIGPSPTDDQVRYMAMNRTWVHLDRGEMLAAEVALTSLIDRFGSGGAQLAEIESLRVRSRFGSGRPAEALESYRTAVEAAEEAGVQAPIFLAEMALAEGALAFGQRREAMEASDRLTEVVRRHVPAWTNRASVVRARVLAANGRVANALASLDDAERETPPGPDGWRLRSLIASTRYAIDPGSLSEAQVDGLVDLFLHSRFYGWAVEAMCAALEHGRSNADWPPLAVALALRLGDPMLAARANAATGEFDQSRGGRVAHELRGVASHLPDDWRSDWLTAPGVAYAERVSIDGDEGSSRDDTDDLLAELGLGPDATLSPAQRRLPVAPVSARRRWLALATTAASVVAVAAVTAYWVSNRPSSEVVTPTSVIAEVASPSTMVTLPPLAVEEIMVEVPAGTLFSGRSDFRGDEGRTGFSSAVGPTSVDGFYWQFETLGRIITTPVAHGQNLIVGSTDGSLYAIDQSSGSLQWTLEADDQIAATPIFTATATGESNEVTRVILVADDGIVRARNADAQVAIEDWATPLGARIRSEPVVVGDLVVVATMDGVVRGLNSLDGSLGWSSEGKAGLGSVSAGLAVHDGDVYVATEAGSVHLLDGNTGEELCRADLGAPVVVNPIVVGGVVYVGTTGNTLYAFPAGACAGVAPDRLPLYITETPIDVAPAIVGDIMYLPSGLFLYAIDLTNNCHVWIGDNVLGDSKFEIPEFCADPVGGTIQADSKITTAPVVTNDSLYFGSRDGILYVIDIETAEIRYTWRSGTVMTASPVVGDGVVFLAGGDGLVTAIGPGEPVPP